MALKLDITQKTQVIQLESVSNYFFKIPKNVFPFQRSSAGSTGVTFLPLDINFKWVVKWQNPFLTEVEYLCTEFYRRAFVHLSVPEAICVIPDELKKKMREVFKGKNISDNYVPMLLEYKNGSTLNKLFEFAHILKLSCTEREKLFTHIGEIAGYDFLIANFDRLAPAGFKNTIDMRHSANGGNLMVELTVPSNTAEWEGNGSISIDHVIDNAPQPILFFAPDERRVEDPSDNLDMTGFTFFEEDDYEKHSVEVESQGVADSGQGMLLREQRCQDFQNFMQANPQEISLLAIQIYIGMKNEWIRISRDKLLDLPDFIENPIEQEAMKRSVEEGLWKARSNLKELPLQRLLEGLEAENNTTTKAAKIVFDFIKKNLAFTQNSVDGIAPYRGAIATVYSGNRHRVLLNSIRNDLYHFDEEKKARIVYNIEEYLAENTTEDAALTAVLQRTLQIIQHFQQSQEILVSPPKITTNSQYETGTPSLLNPLFRKKLFDELDSIIQ